MWVGGGGDDSPQQAAERLWRQFFDDLVYQPKALRFGQRPERAGLLCGLQSVCQRTEVPLEPVLYFPHLLCALSGFCPERAKGFIKFRHVPICGDGFIDSVF